MDSHILEMQLPKNLSEAWKIPDFQKHESGLPCVTPQVKLVLSLSLVQGFHHFSKVRERRITADGSQLDGHTQECRQIFPQIFGRFPNLLKVSKVDIQCLRNAFWAQCTYPKF